MLTEDKQVFADVKKIIEMMPDEVSNKIHTDFMEFIEKNIDSNIKTKVDETLPLTEQNLSESTKEILAIIYRDYICSKSEQRELIKQEKELMIEKEERLREENLRQLEEEVEENKSKKGKRSSLFGFGKKKN